MPDLAQLPATPASSPPTPTDVLPMGRRPPAGAPLGAATIGFGVPLGSLAPAIMPKSQVAAGGNNQATATAIATPIVIVVGTTAGGGIALNVLKHATVTVLNACASAVLVYPPVGGTINGQADPVTINPGGEATFHSQNGLAYFAAA